MEELIETIRTTPIIDNHAHPLLQPPFLSKYSLLSITTEAHGAALQATPSSLSHLRAVSQLSRILQCPPTWDSVVKAIENERAKPNDAWAKRCMESIETILVDDGLDGKEEVFDYAWHDRLVRSKCKRIVRMEKVAEEILNDLFKQFKDKGSTEIMDLFVAKFVEIIKDSLADPEVVGFKSVICYRTGLKILTPQMLDDGKEKERSFAELAFSHPSQSSFKRLDGSFWNSWVVNETAKIIAASSRYTKPIQFHTGLGDNDITLTASSPSHLQDFIRQYPDVPIVLLHSSYPWTKEAGYLATVYENVYADVGEIFPMLSQEGQENAIREVLELCPTRKIMWSTDGHWFPETFLLAVIQVREALETVLPEYVSKGALTTSQAKTVVEDIFFRTSNSLYDLKLPPSPLYRATSLLWSPDPSSNLQTLKKFLQDKPDIRFLCLGYLDYTATPRLRMIPVKRAWSTLQDRGVLSVGITQAALGMLQNDSIVPGVNATGEYQLTAIFSSLRPGPTKHYASMASNFIKEDGSPAILCPRSILSRVVERAKHDKRYPLEFLLGFEIEIVFLSYSAETSSYTANPHTEGHNWSSARALQSNHALLAEISDALASANIDIEQFHSESAAGQYEFVLPALPPLEAVDTLLQAREIISSVVASHGMRATLHPKPFADAPGTASHVHISISSSLGKEQHIWESFYAGILKHFKAILAFTYSSPASYERIADGFWAGGRWITWGTQNREVPLRKIQDSHWEIKALDGLANVYLAVSAILACGIRGIKDQEQMIWKECLEDPAKLTADERAKLGIRHAMPTNLRGAMEELLQDQVLSEELGKDVIPRYLAVKATESKMLGEMGEQQRKKWIIDRY